jgi:signal transduction histidine kinase
MAAWKPVLLLMTLLLAALLLAILALGLFMLPASLLRTMLTIEPVVLLLLVGRVVWLLSRGFLKRTLNLHVLILLIISASAVYLTGLQGTAAGLTAAAGSFMLPIVLSGLAPDRRTLLATTIASVLVPLSVLLLPPLFPDLHAATREYDLLALAAVTLFLFLLAIVMDRVPLTVRAVSAILRGHERIRAALNRRVADKTRDREAAEAATVQALDKERAARARLEEINEQLVFLTDLGLLLTSDLDRGDWLTRLPGLLVPRLAVWSALDLIDGDDRLYRVAVARQDEHGVPVMSLKAGEDQDTPLTPEIREALEGHSSVVIRQLGPAAHAAAEPEGPWSRPRTGCEILIPLRTHGKILGVLTLISTADSRALDSDQQRFLIDVGRQAALAIDNTRLYNTAVDLTAELEQRVTRRTAQLQAVNAELEAFTYSASHDLRGPLRGIDGFSQALAEDYGDRLDETALGYIARIRRGASRMGELIDDLLSLSRLARSPLQPTPVDIGELARELFADLQEAVPRRSAKLVLQGDLRAVADRRLLLIALDNLLANSWKFSAQKERTEITVGAREQDGETVFFVQDNGVGFDMEYAAKLFLPFQRLHSHDEFEGSGIGLATVYRIISRHGGHIWAEGSVKRGATFFFTLPEPASLDARSAALDGDLSPGSLAS